MSIGYKMGGPILALLTLALLATRKVPAPLLVALALLASALLH